MIKLARRFEAAEWPYDGSNGKVIKWTLAHGGKSTDPSAQMFVVGGDGKVVSRIDDAQVYTPAAVAEWMKAQADAYEKEHPRTAVALTRAAVTAEGEGDSRVVRCAEVDAARAAKRPVLLYFGRDTAGDDKADGDKAAGDKADDDKARKAECAASRKLEKGALDSKAAAEAAQTGDGCALLRFDLADPVHAEFAKSLGVDKAPALLLWLPDEEQPARLPATLTGPDLAYKLKKAGAPAPK